MLLVLIISEKPGKLLCVIRSSPTYEKRLVGADKRRIAPYLEDVFRLDPVPRIVPDADCNPILVADIPEDLRRKIDGI